MVTQPTATESQRSIQATVRAQLATERVAEQAAKDLMKYLTDAKVFRSCLTCYEWNHEAELCKRHNNARPPATIIVHGCNDHNPDIPF